jgi:hypothetical protein
MTGVIIMSKVNDNVPWLMMLRINNLLFFWSKVHKGHIKSEEWKISSIREKWSGQLFCDLRVFDAKLFGILGSNPHQKS